MWRVVGLVGLLLTSGCLGGTSPEPETDGGSDVATSVDEDTPGTIGVPAPTLTAGTSFTYRGTGIYDGAEEFTVVVGEAGAEGYLMAGATEEDLIYEVVWGRVLFGPHGPDLDRVARGAFTWTFNLFEFPLTDGSTWMADGNPVVATATDIATPSGTEPGFRMVMTSPNHDLTWEFAPSVGYITRFSSVTDGVAYMDWTLVAVGRSNTWVWYEPGARFDGDQDVPPELSEHLPVGPSTFDLPAGQDALVISYGGMQGARMVVEAPPAAATPPWTFEQSRDGEIWSGAILPGHEGTWTYGQVDPQQGYGWISGVAVTWVRP